MIRILLPLAVLGMACTPVPATNEVAAMPDESAPLLMACDAAKAQDIVGKVHTDSVGKDALARTGSRTLRVIKPGMAVTMDYRTDRLNIEVDGAGRTTTVRCG